MLTALEGRVYWTLRVAAALCFIGHGAFGLMTKPAWLAFFGLVGISAADAYRLMPLIGSLDISLGLLLLWRPRRALLAWMAFWCAWTALLRPLCGMSPFETLERAGNYGVPLALLIAAGGATTLRGWLAPVSLGIALDERTRARVERVLRATVFLLLVGHGGLALAGNPLIVGHMEWLGLAEPAAAARWMGGIDIALGALALLSPARPLLLIILGWKLATELLYPLSGDWGIWIWEFVERAGSYGAPLALFWLRGRPTGGQ